MLIWKSYPGITNTEQKKMSSLEIMQFAPSFHGSLYPSISSQLLALKVEVRALLVLFPYWY